MRAGTRRTLAATGLSALALVGTTFAFNGSEPTDTGVASTSSTPSACASLAGEELQDCRLDQLEKAVYPSPSAAPSSSSASAPPPVIVPPAPSSSTTAADPATATDGVWISNAKLMSLPTSGPAWTAIETEAKSSWGTANLADNNSIHDTKTLAGAYVAARTGDAAMRDKVIAGLKSAQASGYARVLEMSRNITSYVIAADVIGYQDPAFKTFVSGLRTKALSGHSGGTNLRTTAQRSPNNWGTMARAAMAAIDRYLGDTASLQNTANVHAEWLGADVPGFTNALQYTSTTWHTDTPKRGINKPGAVKNGNNLDGVLPEDQRRTGEYAWPAPKGSYPWEALQGAVVTAEILDHAGVLPFGAADNAMLRAPRWLYNVNGNPAAGDDTYQTWVYNTHGGTFPTSPAGDGKNMGWTDWTHAN